MKEKTTIIEGSQFGFVPKIEPGLALVTGAARRVGAALALDLAAAGWRVAVHYRNSAEAAEALTQRIIAQGGYAKSFQADLAREAETQALMPRIVSILGPVTLLVNNASTFEWDQINNTNRTSWDAHIEPNLRAPLILSQAMAMGRPKGKPALIVNILDQRVWRIGADFLSYTISKAGLWAATQSLALALAPWIRVVAIGPGPTLPSPRQSPEDFRNQCAALPLQRGTGTDEICATLQFLIANSAITGQMIALDGGQHLDSRSGDTTALCVE